MDNTPNTLLLEYLEEVHHCSPAYIWKRWLSKLSALGMEVKPPWHGFPKSPWRHKCTNHTNCIELLNRKSWSSFLSSISYVVCGLLFVRSQPLTLLVNVSINRRCESNGKTCESKTSGTWFGKDYTIGSQTNDLLVCSSHVLFQSRPAWIPLTLPFHQHPRPVSLWCIK